jgi:hypothetical protein
MAQVISMFDEDDSIDEDEQLEDEAPSPPSPAPRADFAKQGNNPMTTRGIEEMDERVPGTKRPPASLQLLSVFGDRGQVRVALAMDGKQHEEWREPTRQEWDMLKARGRIVKGGLAASPEVVATPAVQIPAPQQPPVGGGLMPKLLLGGLAVAGLGAAFYFWRQNKQMDENIEEV